MHRFVHARHYHIALHTHTCWNAYFFGGKQNLNILGLVFRFETHLKSVSITRRFRSVGTPIVATPSVPPAAASHTPSPIFATKNKTVNRQNIYDFFKKSFFVVDAYFALFYWPLSNCRLGIAPNLPACPNQCFLSIAILFCQSVLLITFLYLPFQKIPTFCFSFSSLSHLYFLMFSMRLIFGMQRCRRCSPSWDRRKSWLQSRKNCFSRWA